MFASAVPCCAVLYACVCVRAFVCVCVCASGCAFKTDTLKKMTSTKKTRLLYPSDINSCAIHIPGPFQPCDDLFGWWSLRCGVWIVFMLAVIGNGMVLVVSIFNTSKLDVTRFLICNLALSDLCMGIYLGVLAIVDASTLGKN